MQRESHKINYFGTTELIFNGKIQSRQRFNKPSSYYRNYIPSGHTWLGYSYMDIPEGINAKMKITISYSAYKFFYGHAYPNTPYQYIINNL